MPHFVIDCSPSVLDLQGPATLIREVPECVGFERTSYCNRTMI